MPRGNRRDFYTDVGLTLGLLFSVGLMAEFLLSEGNRYGQEAASRSNVYASHAKQQIVNCARRRSQERRQCAQEAAQAGRSNQREEQDLAAQKQSAWWSQIMGISAFVGMLLSGLGVFLVWTTFIETRATARVARKEYGRARIEARKAAKEAEAAVAESRRANEIAERNAHQQMRPYVYFGDAILDLPLTLRSKVRIKVKNHGSAPAINVKLGLESGMVSRPIADQARDLKATYWQDMPPIAPQAETTLRIDLIGLSNDELRQIRDGESALITFHSIKYEGFGGITDSHEMTLYIDKTTTVEGDVITLNEWARHNSHIEADESPELDLKGGSAERA